MSPAIEEIKTFFGKSLNLTESDEEYLNKGGFTLESVLTKIAKKEIGQGLTEGTKECFTNYHVTLRDEDNVKLRLKAANYTDREASELVGRIRISLLNDSQDGPIAKKPRLESDSSEDTIEERKKLIEELNENKRFVPSKFCISNTPCFQNAVIQNQLVIDKSEIIAKIFDSNKTAFLITCPRRWGKSFNLDLIKSFCEFEMDKVGRELPEDLKINRLLFKFGSVDAETYKRTPMEITKNKGIMTKHFGKYIVLRLDFKDLDRPSYDEVISKLNKQVVKLYHRFAFLEQSTHLSPDQVKTFRQMYSSLVQQDSSQLADSLSELCYYCNQHFKRKIVLLVDEYDIPTNNAFYKFAQKDIEQLRNLIKSFLGSVVKGQEKIVQFTILTGVLRLAKDASVSPFNNVTEYDVADGSFAQYYGFTQLHINLILKLWSFASEERYLLKRWYNGYSFPERNAHSVYSPWSVMMSLNECLGNPEMAIKTHFKSYWVESGSLEHVKRLLFNVSILDKLVCLLNDDIGKMQFKLIKYLSYSDMTRLNDLLKNSPNFDTNINSDDQNILFSYLYYTGYFSTVSYNSESKMCQVRFPNLEIKEFIKELLKSQIYTTISMESYYESLNSCFKVYLESSDHSNSKQIKSFCSSFVPVFHQFLLRLPPLEKLKSTSLMDHGPEIHANEDVVHCLLVSIILYSAIDYQSFGSEVVCQNYNRCDLIIIHKRLVLIIELKFGKNATAALKQIREKGYHLEYKDKYDLLLVGLNIDSSKRVTLEAEFLPKGSNKSTVIAKAQSS